MRAIVAALAGLALLAACTADKQQTTIDNDTPVPAASAPSREPAVGEDSPELAPFYTQTIAWADCDGFHCAQVTAPLDWSDPGAGQIQLALKRLPASGGQPVGSLLLNPGGPGGSGLEFLPAFAKTAGERLRSSYDLVAFDPRGVGDSTPVRCLDDATKDVFLARDYSPDTPDGLAALAADARAFGEACATNTGPLLGHVDTQSVARDLDLLRAVLGDETLSYLGFSYGTQLGATYAALYPARVGRMVLDGGIDLTLDSHQVNLQQAEGFERALRNYVQSCQAGSGCPLTGGVEDGLAQIKGLVERAKADPLPTASGRELTQSLAFYGIAVTLYANETWSYLSQALGQALDKGDGTALLAFADIYNKRNADGTFASNSMEVFRAVNCLDSASATDVETMRREAAEILAVAPTLGASFGYGGVFCEDWPYPPVEQDLDLSAEGAPPIVVIGTTQDPATPYAWSQGLAGTLSSGVLVTFEGEGHTAYGRSNDCIASAVDGYLVDGAVPADGLTC